METNVNYTAVGAFVILLFTSLIVTIIWLSAGVSSTSYSTYQVFMKESVNGLNVDAPVEYNGVNVGIVKSVELDHINPHLVVLLLKIKGNTPITRATTATLNVKGLTGLAYVALQDKGTDMTPLVVLKGQSYPVINTSPSLFLRLDTALTQLNENLRLVSHSIQGLLDPDNLVSIKGILLDFRKVSDTLANNSKQFDTILQNTAKISGQFSPLIQNSLQAMQQLTTQTLPKANQAVTHIAGVASNFSSFSTQLAQNPSVLIRGSKLPPLGPGE